MIHLGQLVEVWLGSAGAHLGSAGHSYVPQLLGIFLELLKLIAGPGRPTTPNVLCHGSIVENTEGFLEDPFLLEKSDFLNSLELSK